MKLRCGKFLAPIVLCLLLASCAQTGPPLPPSLELPKPPTDLRASRKGNRITLAWSEPTLTTDRRSVRYIGPTLVCRGPNPEIAACTDLAATLPAPSEVAAPPKPKKSAAQKAGPPRPAPQIYVDALPANLQKEDASADVTYAVEILNRNARGAGISNRVHVPAVFTLPPPSDLTAQLTGDGVILSWTAAGESQKIQGIQHRYRIYRSEESSGSGKGKDADAGEIALGEPGPTRFTDSGFEWEKTYLYRITAVTIVKRPDSEVQIEGDDSASVRVVAHDVFPPSVPAGLQAAYSGEGQKPFIDLIWAPVTNADLAGYNVFRSEATGVGAGTMTASTMVKLNSDPVKSPSYRDSAVVSGTTYTYTVSAIDVRGNESQRSETTSESVP